MEPLTLFNAAIHQKIPSSSGSETIIFPLQQPNLVEAPLPRSAHNPLNLNVPLVLPAAPSNIPHQPLNQGQQMSINQKFSSVHH